MGTFKLPRDGAFPGEYGILKPETVPQGIVRQHLAPFTGKW
jgi:lathosterol oxidase